MVFSGYYVSSTNKTDRHNIIKIVLNVALNIINQTKPNQTKPKAIKLDFDK